MAKENFSIAAYSMGIVKCTHDSDYNGDLFLELRHAAEPRKEYIVPHCVVSADEVYLYLWQYWVNELLHEVHLVY